MSRARRRILFVAMYPVGTASSGPEVRIGRLLAELRGRVQVDLVDGFRGPRRLRLWRYALSGRLRSVAGVYVESSTALPSETDVAFLALARLLRRPVVTYVRDAYQLFPDYFPLTSPKRRLSARLFPVAVAALRAVSTRLATPSRGLAAALVGEERAGEVLLLPPGAPPSLAVPPAAEARSLLFVGDMRIPAQGGDALIEAVERARERGADLELLCVTRPGGEPSRQPPWVRVERANSDEIAGLLPQVLATVIPREPGAYNDLALPIKLMEYLAYGRPIIATDRAETARIVRDAGCGVVAGDGVEGLADALCEVAAASPDQHTSWGRAAAEAARQHAWGARAEQLLEVLGT